MVSGKLSHSLEREWMEDIEGGNGGSPKYHERLRCVGISSEDNIVWSKSLQDANNTYVDQHIVAGDKWDLLTELVLFAVVDDRARADICGTPRAISVGASRGRGRRRDVVDASRGRSDHGRGRRGSNVQRAASVVVVRRWKGLSEKSEEGAAAMADADS